ncbi:MAG: DUF2953 domain-containing protein [Oscillospiraceae bacterium]|nr:DUF2953 domain-containing protein [Oscillospiraceae bacterium]
MIALYILLGILGFLLFILCLAGTLKLSVRAAYCDSPLLIIGIGPIKLKLLGGPKKEKPKEEKPATEGKKKKPKKKKKKEKKPKKPGKVKEQPPLTAVIASFRDLLLGLVRGFKRHLKIEELRLRVLVASGDAATTAMEYGAVCTLVEPLYSLATQAHRVRKDRVNVGVECDFLAEKPEVDAEFCISIRIWRIYWIALCSTRSLIRALSLLKAYLAGAKAKKEEKKAKKEAKKAEKEAKKEAKKAEKEAKKQAKQAEKQKTVSPETDG